jgi:SAM-dependent methyltransferase
MRTATFQPGPAGAAAERWETSEQSTLSYAECLVPLLFGPWAHDLVAHANLATGERVLDLACGTGAVAVLARQKVGPAGAVWGLDRNPQMLQHARARKTDLPIEWRQGGAEELPFEDGNFDVVLCQQGFQFFSEREAAARELSRVLDAQGRALASVWANSGRNPWAAAAIAALESLCPEQAEGMRKPFSMGSGEDLAALFLDFFDEVRMDTVQMDLMLPDAVEFARGFVAALPFAGQVSAHSDALAAQIAERLEPYRRDGMVVVPSEVQIARGASPRRTGTRGGKVTR